MDIKINKILLSIETQEHHQGELDYKQENTDVIVVMDDGNKYIASFFAYDNIEKLKKEHRQTGEYLAGRFFTVDNMVLVERCTRKYISDVVEYLIDEGDFYRIFRNI